MRAAPPRRAKSGTAPCAGYLGGGRVARCSHYRAGCLGCCRGRFLDGPFLFGSSGEKNFSSPGVTGELLSSGSVAASVGDGEEPIDLRDGEEFAVSAYVFDESGDVDGAVRSDGVGEEFGVTGREDGAFIEIDA